MKQIYAYLKNYKITSTIKFRTDMPDYSKYHPEEYDWSKAYYPCYEDVPEGVPADAPTPKERTTFVEANLMHEMLLVARFPKRQNTVETATVANSLQRERLRIRLLEA